MEVVMPRYHFHKTLPNCHFSSVGRLVIVCRSARAVAQKKHIYMVVTVQRIFAGAGAAVTQEKFLQEVTMSNKFFFAAVVVEQTKFLLRFTRCKL